MVIIYNSKKQKQPSILLMVSRNRSWKSKFILTYYIEHIDTLPPATEQKDKVLEALKNRLEEALSEHQETQQRNMELEKEKDELLKLIKDYEISLETVTSKLRTYAVSFTIENMSFCVYWCNYSDKQNTTLEEQSQLRQEYSAVLEAEKVKKRVVVGMSQ